MFDYFLFFGYPLDEDYREKLERTPLAIRNIFIQGSDEYLQCIEREGISYLGKSLGQCIDRSAIELAQAHIMSLLKRLVPDYCYHQDSMLLLAVQVVDR